MCCGFEVISKFFFNCFFAAFIFSLILVHITLTIFILCCIIVIKGLFRSFSVEEKLRALGVAVDGGSSEKISLDVEFLFLYTSNRFDYSSMIDTEVS